jgi:hypothetical protein
MLRRVELYLYTHHDGITIPSCDVRAAGDPRAPALPARLTCYTRSSSLLRL